MKSQRERRRSGCPISFTLDFFGDKWTLLVVRDMMFKNKNTYGEFLESGEGIATNILADRLKRLEESEIIFSSMDPDNRKKVIYQLTDKGIDLLPMVLEMVQWGAKYDSKTEAPKDFITRLKKDKATMIEEFRSALKKQRKRL